MDYRQIISQDQTTIIGQHNVDFIQAQEHTGYVIIYIISSTGCRLIMAKYDNQNYTQMVLQMLSDWLANLINFALDNDQYERFTFPTQEEATAHYNKHHIEHKIQGENEHGN